MEDLEFLFRPASVGPTSAPRDQTIRQRFRRLKAGRYRTTILRLSTDSYMSHPNNPEASLKKTERSSSRDSILRPFRKLPRVYRVYPTRTSRGC